MESVVSGLISLLERTPLGVNNPRRYVSIISGIIEILFYPYLINPSVVETYADNFGNIKFEYNFSEDDSLLPFTYSHVYFYIMNGVGDENDLKGIDEILESECQMCFIIFRSIENITSIMKACKEKYRNKERLLIPLSDNELIKLLRKHDDSDKSEFRIFINKQINKVIY